MHCSLNEHLGRRIRARRKELRMSLATVAKALGISLQAVFKYETGETRIPAWVLLPLAEVLRAPTNYFFDDRPASTGRVDRASADSGGPRPGAL